jgi:hypothetical protein
MRHRARWLGIERSKLTAGEETMHHRILATAIALLLGLSMPVLVAAKGLGGGQKGGFRGGGGIKGGGGGNTGGGGKVSGGTGPAAPRGSAPARPASTSRPRDSSSSPNGNTSVRTAVGRSPRSHDVFVVTPSIYTPRFSRSHFPGVGFRFGIRHLGYGFGPAYYGLGFAPSLFCETAFDCDIVPMIGVVDEPSYESVSPYPPYQAVAPYEPPIGFEFGSVRVDVEPPIAQIFVDGEYLGTVEDYKSGSGLPLEAGVHRVEFRAPGYEPLVVDMRIAAGRRITYRGVMKPPSP